MATEIKGTKMSELTEVVNVNNDDYLLLLTNGENRKVKAKQLKGADNLSNKYLDLVDDDGQQYRMTINTDGTQTVYPIEAYTGPDAMPGSKDYSGLIINQIYGGGPSSTAGTSVSHSFIELYNDSDSKKDINLKGMYLFYSNTNTNVWQRLKLTGVIPYQHSFLIRGKRTFENSNVTSDLIRCKIDKYDQEWDMEFDPTGFTAFLAVGGETPTADDIVKEKTNSATGEIITSLRFIDIMAGNSEDGTHIAPGYAAPNKVAASNFARNAMNKNTAIRKIDFGFNSSTKRSYNCFASVEAINYETCDVSIYRPRSIADGSWDYYVDRIKLNQNIPNLVNICYGKDGETSRTFTWQSKVTDTGYLKYRMIADENGIAKTEPWVKVETKKEMVKHHDQDCTIHRVIIKNLKPGKYEYQAGEEGGWSDTETFDVKKYLVKDGDSVTYKPMRILWTTDQQGWTPDEYRAWKTAVESIAYHEGTNFDWHLNTGDVSQNASRSFEWRYYFKHSREFTRNMCHEITCGNNDLIDKKYGKAFNYYLTAEDAPKMNDYVTEVQTPGNPDMVSTYAFDLGYVHFVCVNSNEEQMYSGVTVNNFIAKQCAWLDAHLAEVKQRETQPRWIIVYMHLSPFTCVRTPRVQPFVPVFEKYKVDVVLCGHNHTYTRSKCLYTGFNGVPYKEMGDNGGTGITYNRYVKLKQVSDGSIENLIPADKEYKDYTKPEGGVINRAEDKLNGTYYVMNAATGFKSTGKETGITFAIPSLINSEHSNKEIQSGVWPWWYAWWGGVMSQPAYMTIDITGDQIKFVAKQVPNVLTKEYGVVTVNDFDYNNPDKFKPNSDYDPEGLIINYQEERHTK